MPDVKGVVFWPEWFEGFWDTYSMHVGVFGLNWSMGNAGGYLSVRYYKIEFLA